MTTLTRRITALVAIAAAGLSLTACGSGSKPSKENVTAGIEKIFADQAQFSVLPKDKIHKLSTCITDKIYDEVSPSSLKAIADGKDVEAKGDEGQTVFAAARDCASSMADELVSGS